MPVTTVKITKNLKYSIRTQVVDPETAYKVVIVSGKIAVRIKGKIYTKV